MDAWRIPGELGPKGKQGNTVSVLIDTGASISLRSVASIGQTMGTARGVGGRIQLGSKKTHQLSLAGHKFQVQLRDAVLPERGLVILGRDFLKEQNSLKIEFDNNTLQIGEKEILLIEDEFEAAFAENPKAPRCCNQLEHKIVTEGHPVKCKTWPLAEKNREEVAKQIKVMLEAGIITESESPYAQNVILVDKSDGGKRFCVDYRLLNKQTKDDPYPLTSVPELLREMSGSKFFSQVDLASGYWTVPIRAEDQEKTAFVVPGKGKYHFLRMPFGLRNSQATLQRIMDKLANEVREKFRATRRDSEFGIGTYVDNLIWFSQVSEVHDELTRLVMETVLKYNLSLRRDKCMFKKNSMEFLGSTVKMATHNRKKVIQALQPTGKREVRRFLGLVNFNRHFMDKYSQLMDPLYQVTGEKSRFTWGPEQEAAFKEVKRLMLEDPNLHLPVPGVRFHIDTDASGGAIGGILYQVVDGEKRVNSYFSKKLSKAERNWTVTEREFFAIVEASRKFRYECAEGVTFHTDHEPLTCMQGNLKTKGKHARWLLELEAANYDIDYTPGTENGAADCLSRLEIAMLNDDTDWVEAQERDPELKQVRAQIRRAGKINKGRWRRDHLSMGETGVLQKGNRKIVPVDWQKTLVESFHQEVHLGVEGTISILTSRFAWKGMRKTVEEVVLQCRTCLQSKPGRSVGGKPAGSIAADRSPRERICVDFAAMAPSPRGKDHILVMTDTVTGFSMVTPTKGETAEEAIRGTQQWLAVFGLPREILSDNGPAFQSMKWKEYLNSLGVKKLHSSPYHPQGNGRAEKTVGLVTQAVRCILNDTGKGPQDWVEAIPTAVRTVNANKNRRTRISPHEAMLGGPPRMIGDNKAGAAWDTGMPPEEATKIVKRAREEANRETLPDSVIPNEEFTPGEEVLLKESAGSYRKMRPLFKEGYEVIRRIGPVNYIIRKQLNGEEKGFHRDKLKKAGTRVGTPILIQPQITTPIAPVPDNGERRYPMRERKQPDFDRG
eukprot:sb/3461594/